MQAVVFTNLTLDKSVEFDDYCRSQQPPISFIKAASNLMIIVKSATVFCIDDERLEFKEGDLVVFKEVNGMAELNDGRTLDSEDVLNFYSEEFEYFHGVLLFILKVYAYSDVLVSSS